MSFLCQGTFIRPTEKNDTKKTSIAERYEQGASQQRLQQYANRWLALAKGRLDQHHDWTSKIGVHHHETTTII